MDTKLDVPYFSQYRDVHDCDNRLRACGMTCAYMILTYFGAEVPTLDELIVRGMREGGYGPSGWVHDYFVKLFQDFGFACERREQMPDEEVERLRNALQSGNPVIVSVVRRMWEETDFHMVVLTGYREDEQGRLEGFFYHNPAGMQISKENRYVPLPIFLLDWRGMAILPSRVV